MVFQEESGINGNIHEAAKVMRGLLGSETGECGYFFLHMVVIIQQKIDVY